MKVTAIHVNDFLNSDEYKAFSEPQKAVFEAFRQAVVGTHSASLMAPGCNQKYARLIEAYRAGKGQVRSLMDEALALENLIVQEDGTVAFDAGAEKIFRWSPACQPLTDAELQDLGFLMDYAFSLALGQEAFGELDYRKALSDAVANGRPEMRTAIQAMSDFYKITL